MSAATAEIIDGKAIAARIRMAVKAQAADLQERTGMPPGLAVVIVGDDPASQIYVRNKQKQASAAGFRSELHELPKESTTADVLAVVDRLNADPGIHGILVQHPVPGQVDEQAVIDRISPDKDADGFHPVNVGRLWTGLPCPVACTPVGIMALIDQVGIDPAGKRAVVVGRSNIVGKPMAALLLARHATVTLCHSRTPDLADHTRKADILVVAAGRPRLVTGEMIKPGAAVFDVGMNRSPGPDGQSKLVGDVDFESAAAVAGHITPVPGGVGPMTIAMLLKNTLWLARRALLPGETP